MLRLIAMSLIDRASTTGEILSHIKNLLISTIYQQLLYLFQVFTGFALAGKLLVFSLSELVLGREAGEAEAGGAELSHTDMQCQGKAVTVGMDLDLKCSTVLTTFT